MHSDRAAQADWLDRPLVRLPPRAVGGMATRPVPGQRALSARSFRRPSPGRSARDLSDVLAGIASALA